jgi:hypothetical protein
MAAPARGFRCSSDRCKNYLSGDYPVSDDLPFSHTSADRRRKRAEMEDGRIVFFQHKKMMVSEASLMRPIVKPAEQTIKDLRRRWHEFVSIQVRRGQRLGA